MNAPAETISKNQPCEPHLGSYGTPIYQIRGDAAQIDILNHLEARMSQLTALLAIAADTDNFDQWTPALRSNFLWACTSQAEDGHF